MGSSLRQDLKKRDPFDSLEQEAILNILRTSDILENRVARLLREYGLTPSQYNVLRILRGEGKPLPCLEVASRMIQVAPAITRVVNQLLERNLIIKQQCPQDRRVFHIDLTDQARDLLGQIDQPLLDLHARQLTHISQDDLKTLIRILEAIRDGIPD